VNTGKPTANDVASGAAGLIVASTPVPIGANVAVAVIVPGVIVPVGALKAKLSWMFSVLVGESPVSVRVTWFAFGDVEVGADTLVADNVNFVDDEEVAVVIVPFEPVGIPVTVTRMFVPFGTVPPGLTTSSEAVLQQKAHPSVIVSEALDAATLPFVRIKAVPRLVPGLVPPKVP
jgi:hypothetical protein